MRSNSPPRSAENIRPFHALPSRRLGSFTHSLRAERRDAATVVRSTMSQPNRAHEKKRGPKPKSYHDPASAATPLAAAAHRRRHHPAARRLQHSCITRFWSNNSLQFSALHTARSSMTQAALSVPCSLCAPDQCTSTTQLDAPTRHMTTFVAAFSPVGHWPASPPNLAEVATCGRDL